MHISILVFGDSVGWGAWDSQKGGWVSRLKIHFQSKKYRDRFRIYVNNLSVGAETTDYLLERFQNESKIRDMQDKEQGKHNIIIFAIGINDSRIKKPKVIPKEFKKNIIELIKQAKGFTSKIIFVGLNRMNKTRDYSMPWVDRDVYNNKNIKEYNSIINKVCRENKINFIPIINLLDENDLEDGLHPNSRGHQKMFEKIKDFLLENNLIKVGE